MPSRRIPLPGSEREPVGKPAGAVSPDESVDVSVILKRRSPATIPAGGAAVSRKEFASRFGADPAGIQAVEAFARENRLSVVEVSPERRTVRLRGSASHMAAAFGVTFECYEEAGTRYRARQGPVTIPETLAPWIEAVLGLDDRPQLRTHFRVKGPYPPRATTPAQTSYTPRQVAQLYQFPADADGSGQCIAILELGGGFVPADLKTYFASLGVKEPQVTAVSVDGGTNDPTTADSADGEVLLDIEVAGGVAPGAAIAVYFAPNTTAGFQDALTTAIHDSKNRPSVISISWGGPESTWTSQAMTAFESAAQDAAMLGITVCAAAGDNGSSDGETDGKNHVDFPASSPHVLACGGTSLQGAGSKITSETVWNDGSQGGATGGGFSAQFPLPSWQSGLKPPSGGGRGVPDVAGNADPNTGYQVLVDGQSLVIGGTSAVAPLWSGMIALLNQKRGKPAGFLQPTLYALGNSSQAFRDITQGSNGSYSASTGWDPCTGLGSPEAQNLLAALST